MGESSLATQHQIQYRVYDITDSVKGNRQYDQDRHEYLKTWAKKKESEVEKWIQQQQPVEISSSTQQTFLLNNDQEFHAYLILKKSQTGNQVHPVVFTTPLVDNKTHSVINQITLFLKPELLASVEPDFSNPLLDSVEKTSDFKRLPSTNEAKGFCLLVGGIFLVTGSLIVFTKKGSKALKK